MAIRNEAKIKEKDIRSVRNAIEHRATWFYFLLDEARKRGLKWDDFARKAIFRTGCFHGERNFTQTSDLREFEKQFFTDFVKKLFEMEIRESTENKLEVEFNYCPLVEAWVKLTEDDDEISHLCDIAMDGDRGIVSTFSEFQLDLQETIASGGDVCRLVFSTK